MPPLLFPISKGHLHSAIIRGSHLNALSLGINFNHMPLFQINPPLPNSTSISLGQGTTNFHFIITTAFWLVFLSMILILLYFIHNPFSSICSGTNPISHLQPKALPWVTTALRIRPKFINRICIIGPSHVTIPLLCLPLNSILQPSSAFSSWAHQILPQLQAFIGYLAFSSPFPCQTMTIHPSGPSWDKTRPDKPSLDSPVWVRWPAVNSPTPCIFPPSNHILLLMPSYIALSSYRPWGPWGQGAGLFYGQSYVQRLPQYYMLNR